MPIEARKVSTHRAAGVRQYRALRNGCAAVALIAAAGVSAVFFSPTQQASAQLKAEAPAAEAPAARVPATFADIVERVKPAVVSISVTNGGKADVASEGLPGIPDLPEDIRTHRRARPVHAQRCGGLSPRRG